MKRFGEDCEKQREVVREARLGLKRALGRLSQIAGSAAKQQRDVEEVYGAMGEVRRAEESLDLALLDLATARGEDA